MNLSSDMVLIWSLPPSAQKIIRGVIAAVLPSFSLLEDEEEKEDEEDEEEEEEDEEDEEDEEEEENVDEEGVWALLLF